LRHHPEVLTKIVGELRKQGFDIQPVPTEGPNLAGEVVRRQIASGTDAILVAGGDGTVNEVLNGMTGTNIPLCVLGGGTANVFANEVGLGDRPEENATRFSALVPVRVALGALRSEAGTDVPRHFLLMAGVGLDARVVRGVNHVAKARFGKLAYYLSSFSQTFSRLPQFLVRAPGVERRCSFALASRVRNYGGDLEIATGAELLDDDFEVVLFEGKYAVRYLPYAAAMCARRLHLMPGVTVFKSRRLELLPLNSEEAVEIQVDGECAGSLPAVLEAVAGGLTLLVPDAFLVKSRKRVAARPEKHSSVHSLQEE
jgi:diacylglycerol kinase (ATP)